MPRDKDKFVDPLEKYPDFVDPLDKDFVDPLDQQETRRRERPPEKPETPTIAGEFGSGVQRGVPMLKGGYYGTAALLGSALGAEGLQEYGTEGYQETEEERVEIPSAVETLSDIGSPKEAVLWASSKVGEQVPLIGETVMTTLLGAALGSTVGPEGTIAGAGMGAVGKRVVRGMIKDQVKELMAKGTKREVAETAARQIVGRQSRKSVSRSLGAKAGLVAGVWPQETGHNYMEALERGHDAPLTSALTGTAATALEFAGGGSRFIGKFFNPTERAARQGIMRNIAANAMQQVPEEFAQEFGQEFLSNLNIFLNDPSVSLADTDALMRYLEAGVTGGVVGGAFGVAGGVTDVATGGARKEQSRRESVRDIAKSLNEADEQAQKGKAQQIVKKIAELQKKPDVSPEAKAALNKVTKSLKRIGFLKKDEQGNWVENPDFRSPVGKYVDKQRQAFEERKRQDIERDAERLIAENQSIPQRLPGSADALPLQKEGISSPEEPSGAEAQKEEITAGTRQRVKYDRADLDDTIRAAKELRRTGDTYIFGTAHGYTIDKRTPPPGQDYVVVRPDGTHGTVSGVATTEKRAPKTAPGKPRKRNWIGKDGNVRWDVWFSSKGGHLRPGAQYHAEIFGKGGAVEDNKQLRFIPRRPRKGKTIPYGFDQFAQMAYDDGIISEPTQEALLEAIRRRDWKTPESIETQIEREAERRQAVQRERAEEPPEHPNFPTEVEIDEKKLTQILAGMGITEEHPAHKTLMEEERRKVARDMDETTGYYPRKYRAPTLERAWQEHQRLGRNFVYADMDLMNLKGLNALLGNYNADKHIRNITKIIRDSVEKESRIKGMQFFRHGGDEFSILFPDAGKEVVEKIMKRAKLLTEEYAEKTGLDKIWNPNIHAYTGIGLHYGTSDFATDVFEEVSDAIEVAENGTLAQRARVEEIYNELRGTTEEERPLPPAEPTDRVEEGAGSPYRGTQRTGEKRKGPWPKDAGETEEQLEILPLEEETEETKLQFPEVTSLPGGKKLKASTNTVTSTSDLAEVVRDISKSAQENFVIIFTDKAGNIQSTHLHSIGGESDAYAQFKNIVGLAFRNKAGKVWLAHNHPSGRSVMSDGDKKVAHEVNNLLQGTDVDFGAMISVTPDSYSSYDYQREGLSEKAPMETRGGIREEPSGTAVGESAKGAEEARRPHIFDLLERQFAKHPHGERATAKTAEDARAIASREIPEGGVLLLANDGAVAGTLSGSKNYSAFRGKTHRKILEEAEKRNANSIIIYEPNRVFSDAEYKNILKFARASGVNVLDMIDERPRSPQIVVKRQPADTTFLSVKKGKKPKAQAQDMFGPTTRVLEGRIPTKETPETELERGVADEKARKTEEEEQKRQGTLFSAKAASFYSQLERAVEQIKQDKITSEQLFGMLKGKVKEDEILQTELREFLAEQSGKSINRDDVLAYIREKKARVVPVEFGGEPKNTGRWYYLNEGEVEPYNGQRIDGMESIAVKADSEEEALEIGRRYDGNKLEVTDRIAKEDSDIKNEFFVIPAMYSTHVVPGGSLPGSYVEHFETVPDIDKKENARIKNAERVVEAFERRSYEEGERLEEETGISYGEALPLVHRGDATETTIWRDGHEPYDSVKNPIVRWRADGRTIEEDENQDVPERKTLFIQEIQPPSRKNQTKMPAWALKRWREIGIKSAIQYAAENGYDSVSIATGEQIAELYDLSKRVSQIEYLDNTSGGVGNASLEGPPTHGSLRAYDHDGKVVIEESIMNPSALEEYIGKELAQRLLEAKPETVRRDGFGHRQRTLSGLDLKVGGEGIKKLYNVDFANFLRKYGEKIGGKFEKLSVDVGLPARKTARYTGPERTLEDIEEFKRQKYDAHTNMTAREIYSHVEAGMPFNQAMERFGSIAFAKKLGGNLEWIHEADLSESPSLIITQAIMDTVLTKGQPLFKARGTDRRAEIPLTPEIKTTIDHAKSILPAGSTIDVVDYVRLSDEPSLKQALKKHGFTDQDIEEGDFFVQGAHTPVYYTGGQFRSKIEIALGSSDLMETIGHETAHGQMVLMNSIKEISTQKELDFLRRRYGGNIEKIADDFGKHYRAQMEGKQGTLPKTLKSLFDKVIESFRKLGSLLRGEGFKSTEDVFGKMFTGEYTRQYEAELGQSARRESKALSARTQTKPTNLSVIRPSFSPRRKAAHDISPIKSEKQEVETRMQQAHGSPETTFREKVVSEAQKVYHAFTRHRPLLDPEADGEVIDITRRADNIPIYAKHRAATQLAEIVGDLPKNKYSVFERVIILGDIMNDIGKGLLTDETLPFGYTNRDEVVRDYQKFRSVADSLPDVKEALNRREAQMDELKGKLVAAGLLPESVLAEKAYFHHQVLEYMAIKALGQQYTGLSSGDVRLHKKGWQIARKGSAKDFNTDYLQSEFEVLSQAISQLEMKETLKELRGAVDISQQVKAQAKDEKAENWKELIPEGYTVWQPEKGNFFYQALSITEKTLDQLLDGSLDMTDANVRKIMAVGAKKAEWVVPENVAQTLDNFRKFDSEGQMSRAARWVLSSWKQWTLLNPFRVLRYNLNNMSGDLDISLAYSPRILKYAKQAAADLLADQRGKKMSDTLQTELDEATKQGAVSSGITIHEIPDISETGIFRVLTGKNRGVIEKSWKTTKDYTNWRENVLRLAAYRFFKDELATGKKLYGASKRGEVDAIKDPTKRAGKLARELIGDYGNISDAGMWIRKYMIPFYSWCVPAETEMLTRDGWKHKDTLRIGEDVLTYNMETRRTEWQPLQDKVDLPFDGELVTLRNSDGFKFQFTEDHRIPVIEKYGDRRSMVLAKELKTHHHIPLVAPHEFGEGSILSPVEAALLGWLVTDGYFRVRNHSPETFEAMLYQKKPDMVAKIRSEFQEFISSEYVHPQSGVICFRLKTSRLENIRKVFRSKDDLPRIITRLDKVSCEAMYEAMLDAEGTKTNGCIAFSQNNGPVLEAFQILAYVLGKAAHIRSRKLGTSEQTMVYVKSRDKLQVNKWSNTLESYTGTVWCPKTLNGTWVMRQHGKVMVTGNCEINAPRYVRLFRNLKHEGKGTGPLRGVIGWKTSKLAVKASILYGLVMLWNATFFPDEEKELGRSGRKQLHLILGRNEDGSIRSLRFQGALSDALGWFALEDIPQDVQDVVSGDVPFSKKFEEAFKAPVQRIVQGARPIEKTGYEIMTGKALYPDLFAPRPVRDRVEHAFRTLSLDMPYRVIAGKPTRGFGDEVSRMLTYKSEPGESAYYDTLEKVREFLEDEGYEVPSITPTKRSNALYYFKQAKRYGDTETAEHFKREYFKLGGDRKNLARSIKKADPISFIPLRYRKKFMRQLDEEDKALLREARKWWKETYL